MTEKYRGIWYSRDDESGYVFEKEGEKIFSVSRSEDRPGEVKLRGGGKILCCRETDPEKKQIFTGRRIFVENMNGYACGYCESIDLWTFTMSMGPYTAAVIRSGEEWLIQKGKESVACILRTGKEPGEKGLHILVTDAFEKELFPLLFAIPVLTF